MRNLTLTAAAYRYARSRAEWADVRELLLIAIEQATEDLLDMWRDR